MGTEESPFNVWLKQRRRALDLTQEDLSECVGCSTVTIQKIELGERRPSKQVAQRLAECLKVPGEEREPFLKFAREEHDAYGATPHPITALTPTPTPTAASALSIPNNLPAPLTPLIGRSDPLEAACHYLLRTHVRLLTLTGVPGIGKTRLSIAVAAQLLTEFKDGVFFVDLAAIHEPDLVASAIGTTLGYTQIGSGPLVEGLKGFIGERSMLLVLDNFEQVLDAAPIVVDLLRGCPALKIVVTSREALHIPGEQQFPVPPLEVPDNERGGDDGEGQALLQYPSVELFVQRAGAVDPAFALTEANSSVVAAICTRLEGLPLAIELAAARVNILTPEDLFSRLDQRLKLLTGGARHLPARLQTLRGAIDWSFRLLNPTEQALFACLGVFAGGATLEATEAVYSVQGDPADVLEGVGSLVDKNLLRREPGRSRFTMLEMVREYALEKLLASEGAEAIRRAHALYFLKFAEEANLTTLGPEETSALDRLEEEHDNLRAALQWCLSRVAGTTGIETGETGLRLAVALSRFWHARGYLSEGRERIASVLSNAASKGQKAKSLRAWALINASDLAFLQTDYAAVRAALDEALDLFQEIGDKKGIAYAIKNLADTAREEGNYEAATLLFEQSLSIYRELGDTNGTMFVLVLMSQAEMRRGFHARANSHLEEALHIAQLEQTPSSIAFALCSLGELMILQGEYQKATPLLEESLAIRRVVGHRWSIAATLGSLGWAALRQGDLKRASQIILESLALRKELRDKGGVAWCLERSAEIEVAVDQPLRAAHMLGAAAALRQNLHTGVDIADRPYVDRTVSAARTMLGDESYEDAFKQGGLMSFDQLVPYTQSALEVPG